MAGRMAPAADAGHTGGGYLGAHSPRLKAARRLTKRAFRQRDRALKIIKKQQKRII